MSRACSVCVNPKLDEINAALAGGETFRDLAKRYETSTTALFRHKRDHLPLLLAQAQGAQEAAKAGNLLEQMENLQSRTLSILDKAEEGGNLRLALMAVGQARGNLELLAKLLGELQQEGTVNLTVSVEWVTTRALILAAVAPYPEARAAVLGALSEP